MMKWMCALAFAACAVAPALAQADVKTTLPDRPLKQVKDFDQEPIKEGMKATGQNGLCTATFIVGTDGKAKNVVADCASPDFVPYVVRAVEGAEFEAEIVGGYIFESRPRRQSFKFGTVTVTVDPRGEKAPVLTRTIQESDLMKVIGRLKKKDDKCDLKFTVGADGVPKDVQPNCTVDAANPALIEAVAKMKYTPGEKGGQPTDWPGISMPITIGKERVVNN